MAVPSVTLQNLLNRMNRWQTIYSIETQFKVSDLDDALRTIKRKHNLPFFQKMGTIKIFQDVYIYRPPEDLDHMIFVDYPQNDLPFGAHMRARFTSLQQFWEDPDYRNDIAEIWDNGQLTLGIRNKTWENEQGITSQQINDASSIEGYTTHDDAHDIRLDYVNYVTGSSSLAFNVIDSSGVATVDNEFTSFNDPQYKRKWFFIWLYFSGLPSSVDLRFGVDSSNYLSKNVTEQFSGIPLTANQWNLVAFDLNDADMTGLIDEQSLFGWFSFSLNDAPSGEYNLDSSYLRGWELANIWYYSKYAVKSEGATRADKQYFVDPITGEYNTNDALVGEEPWADVVMYEAIMNGLTDEQNESVLPKMLAKRDEAWEKLAEIWPDMKQQVNTTRYRYDTDYSAPFDNGLGDWGMWV